MKYFSHSLHLVLTSFIVSFCLIFLCFSLAACSAKRSVIKSVSESATASVSDSRRTFYRTLDSLSRQLSLSTDSISIIFNTEFPKAYTSEMIGCSEAPSDPQSFPITSEAGKRPSIASRPRNASRSASASPSTQVPSYLQRTSWPVALKIYGLHLNDYIEKKSVESADLKDSVNTFTQSEKIKSASKQSSKPSSALYLIFFIFILIVITNTVHRLRRFF